MLVSILINCLNCEEYLRKALDSVVGQTYKNWEIIFIDNLSTDDSRKIFFLYAAKDARFKYHCTDVRLSLGDARKFGWEMLRGDLIAILDSDDYWESTKLEKQLVAFKDKAVGLVSCNTTYFDNNGRCRAIGDDLPGSYSVLNPDSLLNRYDVSSETILLKKSVCDLHGISFDGSYSHLADFDIVLRVSSVSKAIRVNERLAYWRVHEASDTWTFPQKFYSERLKWQVERCPTIFGSRKCFIATLRHKVALLVALILDEGINSQNDMRKVQYYRYLEMRWCLLALVLKKINFLRALLSYYYKKRNNYFA